MKEEFRVFKISNRVKYYVSNLGRIKSVKNKSGKEVFLKLIVKKTDKHDKCGYLVFGTNTNSEPEQHSVHRIVCTVFNGYPSVKDMEVNHKDGNKHNNSSDNLEWVTRQDNVIHAHRNNLIKKANVCGQNNPNFKADDCIYLTAFTLKEKYTRKYLADYFGLNKSTIDSGVFVIKEVLCERLT